MDKEYSKRRGSAASQGYDTRWRKDRKLFLNEHPLCIKCGLEYYYIRNAQGDKIGLFDNTGILVVSYAYDSLGRVVSTIGTLASTVGIENTYRYRVYRYDKESKTKIGYEISFES